MFGAFAEAGRIFLDTADVYQDGESESLLGRLFAGDRDHFVTPVEEIVATFDVLVRQGKIPYRGLSNFPAWRIARGATLAELRGSSSLIELNSSTAWSRVTLSASWCRWRRASDSGPRFTRRSAGDLMAGKHSYNGQEHESATKSVVQAEDSGQPAAVVGAVVEAASEIGVTPSQVAMAWVNQRARKSATAMVPITCPRAMAQPAAQGPRAVQSAHGAPAESRPQTARQPPRSGCCACLRTSSLNGSLRAITFGAG